VIQWRVYHDAGRLIKAFPRLDAAAIETARASYNAHGREIGRPIEEHEQAAYATD
jgi:hypothetical protein